MAEVSWKFNPHVDVVGGANRKSKKLPGRTKYGGELYSYGSHEGLSGSTLKCAGQQGPGEVVWANHPTVDIARLQKRNQRK